MTKIDGVEFEEAYSAKHPFSLADKTYFTLSKKHLILNKLTSGRPRDLDDVQQLQNESKSRRKVKFKT